MPVIRLPRELQAAVEREVAEGRAASVEAFVEDAVLAALGVAAEPSDELLAIIREGDADLAAGRYVTLHVPEELGASLDDVLEEALARRRAAS